MPGISRRDLLSVTALFPVFGTALDWMPDQFAFPRQAAALVARGRVLDCGTGPGYFLHAALWSSRVRRIESVEIDPHMAARVRSAIDWRVRDKARVIQSDVFAYLEETTYRYDVILWDVMPVYNPDGTVRHRKDFRYWPEFVPQLKAKLKPGGLIVGFHEGDPTNENGDYWAVLRDVAGRPHTVMFYEK